MKKIFAILCISFVIVSCASITPGKRGRMMKEGITTEVDSFDGTTITTLNLPIGSLGIMAEVSIGFRYIENKSDKNLTMYTYVYKSDWLFVEETSFNIDGKIYSFESTKNNREVVSGNYIQETNYYSQVDLSFLKKLSSGENIRIRIKGNNYYIDPQYKPEYRELVLEFIKKIK